MIDREFEQSLQQAIDGSTQWASHGWPATFGPRAEVVSSLQQAEELPANNVYRQVAIDYWNTVARLGQEAAAWGRKALHHLQLNNLNAAKDAVYYARYLERPIAQHTVTWESIHLSMQAMIKLQGRSSL
jgi:hypothetical protein